MNIQPHKAGLLFCGLALLTLFAACDHDTDTFDGPSLVDRFGEFMLIEPLSLSRTTVDFAAGEVVSFGASFNKQVEWFVKIEGLESGAVKVVEGFSNELDDINSIWEGGATTLPLFGLERCAVELIIPSEDSLRQFDTLEVVGLKSYEGSLFADFEQDLGSNLFFGNFEFELTNQTGRRDDIPAGQGDWFYYFEGTDENVPPLSGTGWQQISHPMSDIGITETQLEKLVAIRILLISDMNNQPTPPLQVDFGIDFITFTQGGPLEL